MAFTRKAIFNTTVIVSALGYFVDIYDLLLFSIIRVASLKSLGVPDQDLLTVGVRLINWQMAGLLLGGIIWGILGDKKGRLSVLFGSILLYSLANIANAYVQSVEAYEWLRFIAGIGLAGELGAAITLVSETLPKESRGYGTAMVAAVGILGAIFAYFLSELYPWRTTFLIGGGLGLILLLARVSLLESGLYHSLQTKSVSRGNFFMLFSNGARFTRYLKCIGVGIPIWFVIGILITFSPEISQGLGVTEPISAGKAVMYCYVGLTFGDFGSGFLSQWLGSRKKVLLGFILLTAAFIFAMLFSRGLSSTTFYGICVALGVATGYWAVFVTVASEQFGTNLRATVTTTVPNFVRGAVVPITWSFQALKNTELGIVNAALIVGVGCLAIALLSTTLLHETHGQDLDFLEA